MQVEELIKKHKDELLKKRYKFNVGMIMGEQKGSYFKELSIFVYDTCSQEGIFWPVGSDSQNLSKDILY